MCEDYKDKLNNNIKTLISLYISEIESSNRIYCCYYTKKLGGECGECGECKTLYYKKLREKMITEYTI